jgi:hypothetical protein
MKVDLQVGVRESESQFLYSVVATVNVMDDEDHLIRSLDIYADELFSIPLSNDVSARLWGLAIIKTISTRLENLALQYPGDNEGFLIQQLPERN